MRYGKRAFVLVVFFVLASFSSVSAEDAPRPILIGDDGSLRLELPLSVEYRESGFLTTPEALGYPSALTQLLAENRDFVPVKTKIAEIRMVGLLTWVKTEETELGLARTTGKVIEVRPPATDAEQARVEKEFTNPFGLAAAIFFGLLVVQNFAVNKKYIVATFTLLVALATYIIALFADPDFGGVVYATALAFVFSGFALFCGFSVSGVLTRLGPGAFSIMAHRICSGIAGALMIIAILAAIL